MLSVKQQILYVVYHCHVVNVRPRYAELIGELRGQRLDTDYKLQHVLTSVVYSLCFPHINHILVAWKETTVNTLTGTL